MYHHTNNQFEQLYRILGVEIAIVLMEDIVYRFSTKESATHAIVAVHNTDINGQPVKCSWGKESGDPNNAQAAGQVSHHPLFFLSFHLSRFTGR